MSARGEGDLHPGLAGLAIGLMALTVALVLEWVGAFAGFDAAVARWIATWGLEGDPAPLPVWAKWSWIALVAFALPQVVLHVSRRWQWLFLVFAAAILTLSWIPVLALAAVETALGAAMTAWLWASAGSCLYAEKHLRD